MKRRFNEGDEVIYRGKRDVINHCCTIGSSIGDYYLKNGRCYAWEKELAYAVPDKLIITDGIDRNALIEEVIDVIEEDIENDDTEALCELLENLDNDVLINYLPI